MKKISKYGFAILLCAGLLANFCYAEAKESKPSPDVVVTQVTKELLALAKTGQKQLKKDPASYFKKVRDVLVPAVDFESIAKSVMGKRYWLKATEKQREQFVDAFTDSLVETYGKGMANFADLDIKVEKIVEHKKHSHVNYVVQSVKTDTGTNKITYTMVNDELGWRLRNVVLDGVDLGKTFRNQFSQAVSDNKGNIGLAIGMWGQTEKPKG